MRIKFFLAFLISHLEDKVQLLAGGIVMSETETEVEVEPRLKTYQRRRKKDSGEGSVQLRGKGALLGVGGENI